MTAPLDPAGADMAARVAAAVEDLKAFVRSLSDAEFDALVADDPQHDDRVPTDLGDPA